MDVPRYPRYSEKDYFAREKDAYNKNKAEMAQAMIK